MKNKITLPVSIFIIWVFVLYSRGYGLDLEKIKVFFLNGDYKAAITEGEKILASSDSHEKLDELYYILGLSYMKDGNYLRASDIFEIILNEFSNSPFKAEARLGLADTYYLRGDFDKAKDLYKEILESKIYNKLKARVYFRLSNLEFKKGNPGQAKAYLDKLNKEFPLDLEVRSENIFDPSKGTAQSKDIFYSVQVGFFESNVNADTLLRKLISQGYPAYIEESTSNGKKSYRVKVGKYAALIEAKEIEKKLIQEGFPTKVCP